MSWGFGFVIHCLPVILGKKEPVGNVCYMAWPLPQLSPNPLHVVMSLIKSMPSYSYFDRSAIRWFKVFAAIESQTSSLIWPLCPSLLYVNQDSPRAQRWCSFTAIHNWRVDNLRFEPTPFFHLSRLLQTVEVKPQVVFFCKDLWTTSRKAYHGESRYSLQVLIYSQCSAAWGPNEAPPPKWLLCFPPR